MARAASRVPSKHDSSALRRNYNRRGRRATCDVKRETRRRRPSELTQRPASCVTLETTPLPPDRDTTSGRVRGANPT